VTYKGGGPAINALISGEVQFYFASMTASLGAIKSGKVKVLGTSSKTRLSSLPEVPNAARVGTHRARFLRRGWVGSARQDGPRAPSSTGCTGKSRGC